jgi:hypothetical protein
MSLLALFDRRAGRWFDRYRGKADIGPEAQNDAVDPKRHFATANCRIAKGLFDHFIGARQ